MGTVSGGPGGGVSGGPGGGVYGGPGGGGSGTAGVLLSTILEPMLRIAGITTLPGTTPNDDQYGELIPMVNRMLDSWNVDGHRIFTSSIDAYPLVSGQKIYTIGPGGDFDNGDGPSARPVFIKIANLLWPTDPVLRTPIRVLSDKEWSQISIQDITAAPPNSLYYDGSMSDNGLGNIYIYFQPPAGYSLELYTWQSLKSTFTAVSDVAVFPPGYEQAIVWNGGVQIAAMYPLESKLHPSAFTNAGQALQALVTLNSQCPSMRSEAAAINNRGAKRSSMTPYAWWQFP